MRSEAIRPGDVIAGKYRVRTILARSRGFLVEAFHTEFDQRVVIRVLSPALCDEKEIERFRREARTLAKLESEHVARIIDVGTTPDGAFYLVRQYLEGVDLASHLKKTGPLPLQQAVLFILQASEVLAQTHVHNIILRELQPSHLFLTNRMGGAPVVKIIDFGTAKLMRDVAAPTAGGEMTATAMFGLSPYSSPELVRKAKNVDVRTDVWSLGAILYQMLANKPPFDGDMAMLMLQIIKEDPPLLTNLRRDLPPEINNIIGWSLAKDVDGRFANVHAFAHALLPYAPAEGQVLIQRIGEITTAAKQQKRSAPPPAPPPAPAAKAPPRPAAGLAAVEVDDDSPTFVEVLEEDESTGVNPAPKAAGGAQQEQPLERTMFMGSDYVAPSPGPPGMGGGARPPAGSPSAAGAPQNPMFAGAAAAATKPSGVTPPAASPSLLGPSLQLDQGRRQPPPSWGEMPGGAAAGGTTRMPNPTPMASAGPVPTPLGASDLAIPPEMGRSKNTILLAIAGTAIGLSLLAGLVVFFAKGSEGDTPATATTDNGVAVAPPTSAPTDVAAPPTSQPSEPSQPTEPVASAAPTTTPTEPAPPAQPTPVAGGSQPPTPQGGSTQSRPVTSPLGPPTVTAKPTAAPTSTPAGGGDAMGTLVAVAVGGSCAFSVNGASKGSGATIKVPLKPGTYSVSCKPVSGATKSRSVTVTSGGTAMAMFKL